MNKDSSYRPAQGRRVGVVIPYYNGSEFIERAAQSVLEQTLAPNEFVVVDDGSRPDEAERLNRVGERLGFRVITKTNGGQGSARNAGVAATTADLICFLDQDDFFLPEHIAALRAAVPDDDPSFGWAYADLCQADRDGRVIRQDIVASYASHPKTALRDLVGGDMFVLPSASIVARTAFDAVGGFDAALRGYEDDDLFLRLFAAGFSNRFVDRPVTVWCIHEESTTFGIQMARSRHRYFRKLVEMFPDRPDAGEFYLRDLIAPRFAKHMLPEAAAAALGHGGKYAEHKAEYLAIAQDYAAVVRGNRHVRLAFKTKLWLFSRLLDNSYLRSLHALRSVVRDPRLAIVYVKRWLAREFGQRGK